MDAITSSVSTTDSTRRIERYLRVSLATLLAWLTWLACHNEYGNVPIVSDVDTAIHEFGHMLFMPFGIPILGRTMVILGGSADASRVSPRVRRLLYASARRQTARCGRGDGVPLVVIHEPAERRDLLRRLTCGPADAPRRIDGTGERWPRLVQPPRRMGVARAR